MTITHKENLLGVDQIYNKSRTFRLLNNSKIENPSCSLRLVHPSKIESQLLTLGSYVVESDGDFVLNNLSIKKAKKKQTTQPVETVDIDIINRLLHCLSGARTYQQWNNLGILLYCITGGSDEGLTRFKNFGKAKAPDGYDEDQYDTLGVLW